MKKINWFETRNCPHCLYQEGKITKEQHEAYYRGCLNTANASKNLADCSHIKTFKQFKDWVDIDIPFYEEQIKYIKKDKNDNKRKKIL